MEPNNDKCKICKNNIIKTKRDELYICKYCCHIENVAELNENDEFYLNNIKNIGNICILKIQNRYIIWIDLVYLLYDPNILFDWLKQNNLGNNINIYIKIPIIKKILNGTDEYNQSHYFNINSIKLLCDNHDFYIDKLYKIENINEMYYIFNIKRKIEEYNYHCVDVYSHMYDEIIENIYDLEKYI
jgi:hypothetical protein